MKRFKSQSLKQLPERAAAKIMSDWTTRLNLEKEPISDCNPQPAVDLMQMTALNAESMQKKLVCCECFNGECSMCGYKLLNDHSWKSELTVLESSMKMITILSDAWKNSHEEQKRD